MTPDIASALLVGQGPVFCGFFRAAVPHELKVSPAGMATPLVCGDGCTTVEFEDVEEREDMEEDELVRWALLRGINILDTSSAFIALRPP